MRLKIEPAAIIPEMLDGASAQETRSLRRPMVMRARRQLLSRGRDSGFARARPAPLLADGVRCLICMAMISWTSLACRILQTYISPLIYRFPLVFIPVIVTNVTIF